MLDPDAGALRHAVERAIRDVPDFPRPGIAFKDITPVLAEPALFRAVVRWLADGFRGTGVTHVAGIESRGFLLAAPVAVELGAGLIPIRKLGKLPYRTERVDYDLEYGSASLEVHTDACAAGDRVLVVDDVLATGGTALASGALIERLGATVAGFGFLIALGFLPGEQRLVDRRVASLVRY